MVAGCVGNDGVSAVRTATTASLHSLLPSLSPPQKKTKVCAIVNDAFLTYSRARGNDLVTPRPEFRFPGLKDGDRWCLCASRWRVGGLVGACVRSLPILLYPDDEGASTAMHDQEGDQTEIDRRSQLTYATDTHTTSPQLDNRRRWRRASPLKWCSRPRTGRLWRCAP